MNNIILTLYFASFCDGAKYGLKLFIMSSNALQLENEELKAAIEKTEHKVNELIDEISMKKITNDILSARLQDTNKQIIKLSYEVEHSSSNVRALKEKLKNVENEKTSSKVTNFVINRQQVAADFPLLHAMLQRYTDNKKKLK